MTLEEKKAELLAVQAAKDLIEQLPPGVKEWTLQYEKILLEDISESKAADQARDSPEKIEFDWQPILQLVGTIIVSAIKKHWPTASVSAVLSALVSYLYSYFQK